jgi:hypothetical protein
MSVPSGGFDTTSGRPWLVDLSATPPWAVCAAIVPGIITTVLFYFDHNVSSLLAQDDSFKLTRKPTFHWDFLVLGVTVILCGLLGLPPSNGLIPQAPLHVRSLLIFEEVTAISGDCSRVSDPNVAGDGISPQQQPQPQVIGAHEQRWTNLIQSALIGLMCSPPLLRLLKLVPIAALSGLFLYMGCCSFEGNQFAHRVALICTEKRLRHSQHEFFSHTSFDNVFRFTCFQMAILIVIFGITLTPAAICFPIMIGVLIPFRYYVLPRWVDREALEWLDPYSFTTESKALERTILISTNLSSNFFIPTTTIVSSENNRDTSYHHDSVSDESSSVNSNESS